ncbi:hypothetical protein GCM10009559_36720 [Pseudonocardia zijingensis]|uniref:Uncharacterized protein n=1 Tax=Pseudonocardia zijingensis TaxID=153376 RepID=A0ABP4AWI7_9PSEU
MLAAFFRLPRTSRTSAALAERTAEGRGCRAAAAVASAVVLLDERQRQGAIQAAERLAGDSGPATSRVLWVPALIFGSAVFGVACWRRAHGRHHGTAHHRRRALRPAVGRERPPRRHRTPARRHRSPVPRA